MGGLMRWIHGAFDPFHVSIDITADRAIEITRLGGAHVEDDGPLGIVQEAIEGFANAGLKFHPMVQQFNPWDPRLSSVLTYLENRRAPIYMHTGYEEFYGHRFDRSGMEQMLAAHRDLPVVVPHIGFPDLEWGFGLADQFENTWLDLTNVPGSFA
jgi:predicted TIM-barrel fold metal-dependent hydrolase